MSRIRSRDTALEVRFRKELRRSGIAGYRKHPRVFGNPDLAFVGRKIAIFVDGCFWHGCGRCHRRPVATNSTYWRAKIARNRARDRATTRRLRASGWIVIRFWEHQIDRNIAGCVSKVAEVIERSETRTSFGVAVARRAAAGASRG
jgi:DNA mismatch endonuclease Vsr